MQFPFWTPIFAPQLRACANPSVILQRHLSAMNAICTMRADETRMKSRPRCEFTVARSLRKEPCCFNDCKEGEDEHYLGNG
jgi:hypothetical protein